MNEKLNYLEMLKNNVGEEMAEMMSDEITKVMDEQRGIEMEYARLVEQRDQLKGITNKHRLEETKDEIMVRTSITDFVFAVDARQLHYLHYSNHMPPQVSNSNVCFSPFRTLHLSSKTVQRSSADSCRKSPL